MINFLLSLLLAHLATDFVLQTDMLVSRKNNPERKIKLKALFYHWATLLFVSSATVLIVMDVAHSGLIWFDWQFISGLLVLSISHFTIDYFKSVLDQDNSSLAYFFLDQALHLIAILGLVYFLYAGDLATCINHIIGYLKGADKLYLLLNPFQKVLFSLILLVVLTNASNVFIRLLLKAIKIDDNLQQPTGRYIGSLERLFTVIAVYSNALSALIGFYGAKTAVRFKHTQDDEWAEYYLIGTSISALIGIVVGLIMKIFI